MVGENSKKEIEILTQFDKHTSVKTAIQILILTGIFFILYMVSQGNYLLFHSLAEIFSIIIACGIFMVVWNSRNYIDNSFFLIIGIAYLFMAGMDMLHTLSYKGINIIPGYNTNLPTQLWIASRYLQAVTLIAAPAFIGKKVNVNFLFALYSIITSLLLLSIFYWKIFPDCFVEGSGLTSFKIVSEYIISFLFIGSIYFLYLKKNEFDKYLYNLVIISILITIASEICFTLYTSAYGSINLIGHLMKIVSFYLLYKAIIVTGLKNPFNLLFHKLKQKEEALQLTRFSIDNASDIILWMNPKGIITDLNEATCKILKYSKEELLGNSLKKINPEFNSEILDEIKISKNKKGLAGLEYIFKSKDGKNIQMEVEFDYLQFGKEFYYLVFARDITERKKAEAALLESEARFRHLADNAPVMIWMSDANKQCNYCNNRWLEFTGRELEQEYGMGWTESIHPDDNEKCWTEFSSVFDVRKEYNMEYRLKKHDGQYRWILDTGVPRFTPTGDFIGYIGSCLDITERIHAREQIEASLKEKVVLLKEIHHRVKNNLQVISSLFSLQSAYIKDKEAREMFNESRNRVKSMALIHEKLYLSKSLTHVNFSDYIQELISYLFSTYKYNSNTIDLEINIDKIEIDVDFAVNLGLIINELVSNTLKHAFPDNFSKPSGDCKLQIKLISNCDSEFILIIKDNGIGFPGNVDFKNTDSLGLQLVNTLVEQHNGKIELNNDGGAEFSLTFPYHT